MPSRAYLARPGLRRPVGRIPVDHYELDEVRTFTLDLVTPDAVDDLRIFATVADWLEADAGGGFVALGTDQDSGLTIGSRPAGGRLSVTFRFSIASPASIRRQRARICIWEAP